MGKPWAGSPKHNSPAARAPVWRAAERCVLLSAGLLACLAVACLVGERVSGAAELLNALLPSLLFAVCALAAFGLISDNPVLVLSPLFWFFVVSALYFGLGPLVFSFGTWSSIDYVQAFYPIDERTLLRTNFLNVVSCLVVCSAYVLVARCLPGRTPAAPSPDRAACGEFIRVSLLIGAPVRYLVAPLNNLLVGGAFIPGQVLALRDLVLLAIFLMTWLYFRGDRRWAPVLGLLLALEFPLRLSGGAKIEFFFLVLALFVGVYLARPGWKTLASAALLVVVAWFVLLPVTNAVRRETSPGDGNTLSDRLGIALAAFSTEPVLPTAAQDEVQPWWTRLCYCPAQGFCLDRYDDGSPGTTISPTYLYWSFVPRVLAPEKPEMTLGRAFNVEVTGNPHSLSAPGFFGEAYWNGGWALVLAVSAYVGVLFAVLTCVTTYCLSRADYRCLPLVWCGLVLGLRPDDWFIANYVGSPPVALSTCLVVYLLSWRPRQARSPAVSEGRHSLAPAGGGRLG